jgi:hypothetical protein
MPVDVHLSGIHHERDLRPPQVRAAFLFGDADATLTETFGPLTLAFEGQTMPVTSRVRRHVSFNPHLT